MKEIGEIFRARTGDIMDLHEGDQEPVKDLVNSRRLLKVPETAELADARTILGLSSKEDCLLQLWPCLRFSYCRVTRLVKFGFSRDRFYAENKGDWEHTIATRDCTIRLYRREVGEKLIGT